MAKLTLARLKQLLRYEPDTGNLIWLKSRGRARAGSVAGAVIEGCRIQIQVDGKLYKAHRLAVFWVTGRWPKETVDHEDCSGTNNRWNNIRNATRGQNQRNRRINANNTSGFKGVYFHRRSGKYQATIVINRQRIHLGLFSEPAVAHEAYKQAAVKMSGKFARFR